MSSRPSSFVIPNDLNNSTSLRRFLTSVQEQLDKLQGNIADNAATGRQTELITDDKITSIVSQTQEVAAGLDNLISQFELTNALLQGMSDAIAQQAQTNVNLQTAISEGASRISGNIKNLNIMRDNINTNSSNINILEKNFSKLEIRVSNLGG